MNFGYPEKPEIMGQFVGSIKGMREACTAREFPVVSGNVSLYNETNGNAILPTPTIGGIGLLEDTSNAVGIAPTADGQTLILIGETLGHIGASLYLRELEGREEGTPPPVDLTVERRNGSFVRTQIIAQNVVACHDIADGGLLVAVAEMALASARGIKMNTDNAEFF